MDSMIRLLIVEDNEDDALLLVNELKRDQLELHHRVVSHLEDLESLLEESNWDVILADYNLIRFNAFDVLELLKRKGLDIPLIVTSGAVGEEIAVKLLKSGARDYIVKGNWYRLAPAIKRELNESRMRIKKLQSEKAFQNSEKRFKVLTDLAPVGIYQANMSGEFVYVNDRWEKISGLSFHDSLGQGWLKTIHPKDREYIGFMWTQFIQSESNFIQEYRVLKPNGEITWLMNQAEVLLNDDNEKVGYLGTLLDITERMTSEAEQHKTTQKLLAAMEGAIQAMTLAMEVRDPFTAGHQRRVSQLAVALAERMNLSSDEVFGIRLGALIHDIGMVQVPSEILNRPGKLSDIEFELVKAHPTISHNIIKVIDFTWPIGRMVYEHHERLDGSGYPRGLKGDDICLAARILAVVDVIEAMISHRPYRPAKSISQAINALLEQKNTAFDPLVVDYCVQLLKSGNFQFEDHEHIHLNILEPSDSP